MEGFHLLVRSWWGELEVKDLASFRLANNLVHGEPHSKGWSSVVLVKEVAFRNNLAHVIVKLD